MKGRVLSVMIVLFVLSGCSTSTSFMLPPNTDLMINGERIPLDVKDEAGHVTLERRPFFWSSVMGIEYILLQDDKVIKKDRLPSAFRVESIFFPPYAIFYWPIGFRFKCYDLSNPKKEFIEKCATPLALEAAKKNEPVASTIQ
jgi:hypothetical protein